MPGSFVKSRGKYNAQVANQTMTVEFTFAVQSFVSPFGDFAVSSLDHQLEQQPAQLNKAKAEDIFNAIKENFPGFIISQAASADHLLIWDGPSKAYIKKLDGSNGHLPLPILFDDQNNVTVPIYFKTEKDQQYHCAGTVAVNFEDPTKEDVHSNSLVKALMDKKINPSLLTVEDVKLAEAEEMLKVALAAKYTEADTQKDAHQYKLCQSIEKAVKKCTAHWKKFFTLAFMSPEQKKLRIEALEQLQILLLQDPTKMQDARQALQEINSKIRSYASFSSSKFFWTNIIITLCSAMIGVAISEGTFGGALLGAFIGTVLTRAAWLIQNPAKYALESAVSASMPKANPQVDQPVNSPFMIVNHQTAEMPSSYTPEYGAAPTYQQDEAFYASYPMMQPAFNPQVVYDQQAHYPVTHTNTATVYDSQIYPLSYGTSVPPQPSWTPHYGSAPVPPVFYQVPASQPPGYGFNQGGYTWNQEFNQQQMPQGKPLEPVYQPPGVNPFR